MSRAQGLTGQAKLAIMVWLTYARKHPARYSVPPPGLNRE